MNAKSALDSIVARIAAIDAHLSGDDSPLANPWEEIKEQLQTELSRDWEAYLITIEQTISGFVFALTPATLTALSSSLGCSSPDEIGQKLLKRIIQRGKREKIKYRPFDFSYFCYPLLDFTVYARVIERTGWQSCMVSAYSAAAPRGERGEVSINDIEHILTQEDFEKARERGWPVRWEVADQPAQAPDSLRSLFEIPAADAAKVSAEDFDALIKEVISDRSAEEQSGSVGSPPIPEGTKPTPAAARTGQMAGEAAEHAADGVKHGFAGLDALFGRKGIRTK